MNIYIIRHGEAKKDSVFNFEGYPDADLTEVGLKQAQLTGKHISTVPFDAIYSSDLKKSNANLRYNIKLSTGAEGRN